MTKFKDVMGNYPFTPDQKPPKQPPPADYPQNN